MTKSSPNLDQLKTIERPIMRLKALIGPATGKDVFMECLNRLRPITPAWNVRTLASALESLRSRRFLTEDLACAPGLAHPLAVEAVASPDGQAMIAAISTCLPADNGTRYWDTATMQASVARWARLGLLTNDETLFRKQMELHARYCRFVDPPLDKLVAGVAVGADWLASRTPDLQLAVLSAKADRLIGTGTAAPDYADLIDFARSNLALRQDCFAAIADFDVFNGRLDALAALIAAPPASVAAEVPVAFSAAHALLSGDIAAAVARFTEAVKLRRKAARKRKGGLPGYLGLLHACALLAAGGAANVAEVDALLDDKEFPGPGYYPLFALMSLSNNQDAVARDAVQHGLSAITKTVQPPPVSAALLAVAMVLADTELARLHQSRLADIFRRQKESIPLAAEMLAEVLARVADDPAPYRAYLSRPGREATFSFVDMIVTKPSWERALERLEAMVNPAEAGVAAAPKAKRLVWKVDATTGEILPQEQTSQARGWSAGRSVALKRLVHGDPKIDYLDEFDRRTVRTIQRVVDSWHGYGGESYVLVAEETLPALVGHPRVFDLTNPTQTVELVAGRVELVLASAPTGFRLTLSHAAHAASAFVEVETPGRWRVVVIDDTALAAAEIVGLQGITVPAEARDRLAALAQVQMPNLPLRIETSEIEDASAVDGDPATVVRLVPHDDGLKVSLVVRPAGADGPHYLPGLGGRAIMVGATRVRRDLDAERHAAAALAASCPSLGGEGPEWLFETAQSGLELLAELQDLPTPPPMEWPEGQTLAVRGVATVKRFKANVKSTANWFTLGGTVAIDEGLVIDLKDLLGRLDGARGRFVPLDGGGFVALDQHFRHQLDQLRRLGDGLKIPAIAGMAVRDLLEGAGALKTDARWDEFIQRLDEAEDWHPALPAGFAAELRDYQTDGFAWMSRLARWGAGALLADDMGLGKTVQAIAVMLAKAAEGPCLVVAPTSVCGNWQAELARFAPGLNTVRLAESGDRAETLGALGAGDVLIASYGLLAREEEKIGGVTWAMAVLDEAQSIKNADTQRAKAAQTLDAGFRLAMTGTPVENDLDELWSLFRFVNPGLLGSREAFAKRFGTPIQRDNDAAAKAALKALVRPFLLRRNKAAVLTELPARTEQTLLIEMDEAERAFYEALRRRALEKLSETGDRTRIHILAEITKLRQACCHPTLAAPDAGVPSAKLDAFLELVAELREGRHRALVFSQFVGHLSKIRAALDADGVSYQYLDGQTPARDREKRVAAFQAGVGDLFLISLKAGGFGLNLTAADYVIHLDPWWNPAVEDQASDRAHRIGQLRPVTIYRLIAKDSIEEGILALHRKKRDFAAALLEGADASGRLSEEDLLNLIRGEG